MKISNTSIRLRELMDTYRLKQVDIIEKSKKYSKKYDIKLTKADLSQYVSGKVEPGQAKLFLLSRTLGVDEAWLMGFDVPMVSTDKEDETILFFDALFDEARNLLEKAGYSCSLEGDSSNILIIKDSSNNIIASLYDYELVIIYEALRKKNYVTASQLLKSIAPPIMNYYNMLNDTGRREAEKRIEELTHLPKYTAKVIAEVPDHLVSIAAHNEVALTDDELELMEQDITDIKGLE